MKFPQLLICILLYPFIFSQLAIAQNDQVYLDSKYILLGENYTLISYDAANDVLASTILTPNYNSPKQHIVIHNNCSTDTLANAVEILPTNTSGLVCDNQQQSTFTVSTSLINYSYQSFSGEGEEKLTLELSIQGGVELNLNPYKNGLLSDSSYLFLYNSGRFSKDNTFIHMTQEVLLSSLSLSLNQRFSFANTFNFNSLGFSIGIAVENFDFGIQFNAPIRKINQVYAPSVFELYFSFDFSPFRRNNRGVFKRLQIDNY